MAGAKGRSGGARKNSGGARPNSGGARPGAGRKPKAAPESAANANVPGVEVSQEQQPHGGSLKRSRAKTPDEKSPLLDGQTRDPLAFLELVVNDPSAPLKDRIRAAVAAAQYRHTKKHDGGKRDEVDEKAKKAASGRFAPKAPPRLVVSNGG